LDAGGLVFTAISEKSEESVKVTLAIERRKGIWASKGLSLSRFDKMGRCQQNRLRIANSERKSLLHSIPP
jgi:hypothetical protein